MNNTKDVSFTGAQKFGQKKVAVTGTAVQLSTTLDTTASGLFDVTVTHGTMNASNTVKSLVGSFEVLN